MEFAIQINNSRSRPPSITSVDCIDSRRWGKSKERVLFLFYLEEALLKCANKQLMIQIKQSSKRMTRTATLDHKEHGG